MLLSARTHTSFQELGLNASRRKAINWTLALTVVLIASMFVGVLIGASGTSVFSTWTVISHHLFGTELGGSDTADAIIWYIRTPRVLLAAIVGAGLALAGAIMQVLVRNMLADPYILGVNSGASCGAVRCLTVRSGRWIWRLRPPRQRVSRRNGSFRIDLLRGARSGAHLLDPLVDVRRSDRIHALCGNKLSHLLLRLRRRQPPPCCSGCLDP